jgi:preprotein translocase subunit SecG
MYYFISILILVVCVLLGLIVLVQNPKGGGLAANFAGTGSQFMGARQTADFLEKASWTLAIILLVLSLSATMIVPRNIGQENTEDTQLRKQIEEVNQNATAPIDFQAPPPKDENNN